MNKFWIILMVMTLTAVSCNSTNNIQSSGTVFLASQKIKVEVADTAEKQIRGLSERASIEDDEGMLFVYEYATRPSFWMKGMRFGIDIIWIKDNVVVDTSVHVLPQPGVSDALLTRYQPSTEIDKVLEVKSGWIERNNVKIGDRIEFRVD